MLVPLWLVGGLALTRWLAVRRQQTGRERATQWALSNGFVVQDIETRPFRWTDGLRSNEHYMTIADAGGRTRHVYIRFLQWPARTPDIEWDD